MRRAYTPTLPELQAFVQAARAGSVTQAAAVLGLTQSAVSRSVATLEDRLGVRLFHRTRQRLALSDAGRALLPDAERILADLDHAALTVMSFGGQTEVLRLAVLPTFGAAWLIPRLARFAARAPGVTIDMSATLTTPDFDRDPRDAAILRGTPGPRAQVLAEERLVVVAAPSLVAAPLDDHGLARLPLLQQATRPDLWLGWFRDAGLDPILILRGPRFEQFGMVLAAARAGLGVALVPQALVGPDLVAGTLRLASSRHMATAAPYVLIWPARSEEVAAFRAFRDWIAADALPSESPP